MTIEEQEDLILIPKILSGNHAAEKTLYDKYRKIITNYLKKKYSNYSDIDDDVSEIIIKVFLNINTFDAGKSKFKSWVLSIAKYHMIDKWRCNCLTFDFIGDGGSGTIMASNSLSFSQSSGDNSITFATSNTGNAFIANSTYTISHTSNYENSNVVGFISDQISAEDFTLLNMKYVQGYEYCEIGKEFNLTSSTVSNKVNYIKTKIKKNYSKDICD